MEIPSEHENNYEELKQFAINTLNMADNLYKLAFDAEKDQDYEVLAEKCLMAAEVMSVCQRKYVKRTVKGLER